MSKTKMWMLFITIALIGATSIALLHPALGRAPRGARMERIKKSPNWRGGQFHNRTNTPVMSSQKSGWENMLSFLTKRPKNVAPTQPIEAVKTDLKSLDLTKNQLVWFGHSSYLLILGGKKFLVDPVFAPSFPASLMMKAFKGTDLYRPDDLPAIDYLVITHDHYDHLDYGTVSSIRKRVGRVICPLGVGEHLEFWGYSPEQITEMDWYDRTSLGIRNSFFNKVTCLPARHFSGRFLKRNNTLWASFMIEFAGKTIYLGGDTGYGTHFAEIGSRYPNIDLALLENGQYNQDWRYIHTLPELLPQAIHDLKARTVQPVHNSKYSLSLHPWNEPMEKIKAAAQADTTIHLLGARIGKPVAIE